MASTEGIQEATTVDLGLLLDEGEGAIVTLVAGETRLVVHRAVLAARSPVFEAMFRHDTVEASSGQVDVPDVEVAVLRQMVAYCYTLRDPRLPGMAPDLLAAADKYGLSGLKAICEQQLIAQLAVENAAGIAVLGVRHSCPNLTATAIAFIKAYNFKVLGTQGWADAMRYQLDDVIEVCTLLAESPEEGSMPTIGTQPHRELGRTAVAGTPHMAPHHYALPDEAIMSQMRSLSEEEKVRRLIEAAQEGLVEELCALMALGAHLRLNAEDKMSPLHWAAREGQVEAARCLLEGGAEIGAKKRWQYTPLHYAADMGHAAVVRLLVAASADPNARDRYGKTPLHWAAQRGHTEATAALLEAGADKGARTNGGETPLDVARLTNQQEVVQMLA